jgi:phosphoribosylglycinamide formyltransferase-1
MAVVRTAVLISGSGSNLQAIVDARADDPSFSAELVVVVSDRPNVGGLLRAGAVGIPSEVVNWSEYPNRTAFTAAICRTLERYDVELVVLAGFMRILSEEAVQRFPNAILNIHPALLPAFPGAHAVEEALACGVKTTGVTVHFVDEHVDHGPIIAQEPVPVMAADTVALLHSRIQTIEHRLYPKCVRAAASGHLRVEGRTVIWNER